MGRNKKEFAALSTYIIRPKVWARIVKKALLPNSREDKPLSHKINDALIHKARTTRFKSEVQRQHVLLNIVDPEGDKFIPDSRWFNWWGGGHPSPRTIDLINQIIPGTADWFTPLVSSEGAHPLHTLLNCVDMLGRSINADEAVNAVSILTRLQSKWGARRESIDGKKSRWFSKQLPGIVLDPELVIDHHRILTPASIIEHMLWIGNGVRIKETNYHQEWMFDMVSAALCVYTIFNAYPADSTVLGWRDADVAAFIYRLFIHKSVFYTSTDDKWPSMKYEENVKLLNHNDVNRLPEGEYFIDLMMYSVNLFVAELGRFGIDSLEIFKIDPKLYGKRFILRPATPS